MLIRIKKDMHKRSKRIILASVFLVILGLFFSVYIVLNDIASSKADTVDLSSPEHTLLSLQKAIDEESYVMLDQIFEETHYTPVFGELFFGKNVQVSYGFSDDPEISRKRVISDRDFKKIEKGSLKMLTENAGLGLLLINKMNPYPQEDEPEVIKNLLNVAFLIQKKEDQWKLTKLYDFMYLDSDFLEVKDFKLHYIDNSFFLELTHKDFEGNIQSTLLYNFALSIKEIHIKSHTETLCTLNRSNIHAFGQGIEFTLKDDSLHNLDFLDVQGTCAFDKIVTQNPEEKYQLYINIDTGEKVIPLMYYGDLRV